MKDVVDVLQRIPAETPMESAPDTAAAVAPSTAGHSFLRPRRPAT